MQNSTECMAKTRKPMTPYAFVHGLCPRSTGLNWPDFWYMQIERRGMLIPLRNASKAIGYSGFRTSALYTSAEQVKDHVKMLHQGKRNYYLPI